MTPLRIRGNGKRWRAALAIVVLGISPAIPAIASIRQSSTTRTERQEALERELIRAAEQSNSAEDWSALAHFRFRVGDHPACLEALDSLDRVAPDSAYSAMLRGAIAEVKVDYVTAVEQYRRSMALDPNHELGATQLESLGGWLQTLNRTSSAHQRVGVWIGFSLGAWMIVIGFAVTRTGRER